MIGKYPDGAIPQELSVSNSRFTFLSDRVAVAPQLSAADMPEVAAAGFKSVINNRPDFEGGPDQPTNADVERAARELGLEYRFQPVVGSNIQPQDVATFGELLNTLPGPVLAFCRTGTRCSVLFRAATSE